MSGRLRVPALLLLGLLAACAASWDRTEQARAWGVVDETFVTLVPVTRPDEPSLIFSHLDTVYPILPWRELRPYEMVLPEGTALRVDSVVQHWQSEFENGDVTTWRFRGEIELEGGRWVDVEFSDLFFLLPAPEGPLHQTTIEPHADRLARANGAP